MSQLHQHHRQLKIQQVDVSNMLETGQLSHYKAQCGEEMPGINKVNPLPDSPKLSQFHQHLRQLKIQQVDVSNISPAVITRQLRATEIDQVIVSVRSSFCYDC